MCSDDELVLLFMEIENVLAVRSPDQKFSIIQNIENIFDTERDTDLGSFINNMAVIFFK